MGRRLLNEEEAAHPPRNSEAGHGRPWQLPLAAFFLSYCLGFLRLSVGGWCG